SDRSLELRNSSATQFLEAVRPVLPLPPKIHTQSSADPRSQVSEHARGLTEAKVAAPSNQVWSQLFDDLWQRFPQRPASHVPDPRLECGEGLRRAAALAIVPPRSRLSSGSTAHDAARDSLDHALFFRAGLC